MEERPHTPPWMWIVGATILLVVVGYALSSRQPVRQLKFPGGEVQFGDVPTDQSVRFSISYDGAGRITRDGTVSVYINGGEVGRLSVEGGRRSHTVTASVPRPGTYSYRIEQVETHLVSPLHDREAVHAITVTMNGEGKIDIQPGVAYKVVPTYTLGDYGGWSTSLQPVLSEQERAEERAKAQEELDKIIEGDEEDRRPSPGR